MLKADLHIHTKYSMDCDMPLERIISRCQEVGIDCIAIADHGSIEGALKMQEMAPFPVIIAEEILTPYGEIMGVFLKEDIPTNISIEEAIAGIKAQDALVCLPHPFDTLRGLRLNSKRLEELAGQIDMVEVFNARSPFFWTATRARNFAIKHDIPQTAGSDAHSPVEIGNAYVEMLEFNNKEEFLQSLSKSEIHGHRSNPLVHLNSAWARVKKLW